MKWIRSSIARKTFVPLLLMIFTLVSGILYITLNSISDTALDAAARRMNLICQTEGRKLYQEMTDTEENVNNLAGLSALIIKDTKSLENSANAGNYNREGFKDAIVRDIEYLSLRTEGVLAYYLCFNPELTGGVDGVRRYRESEQQAYQTVNLADIQMDEHDQAPWFWDAFEQKEGVWIEPYENTEGRSVITYAAPIVYDNKVVAVIGMEISFDILVDNIQNVSFLSNGYAYLITADGRLVAHPKLEYRNINQNYVQQQKLVLSGEETVDNELIKFQGINETRFMAYRSLPNDMYYCVSASENDIYAERNRLIRTITYYSVMIAFLLTLLMALVLQRTIWPLKELTLAARKMANGNLNVDLKVRDMDEVGKLTETFIIMKEQLQMNIEDLEISAFQDDLTHVLNKAAYSKRAEELQKRISNGIAEFAVVMCDINELKRINDEYGHLAGDRAITMACRHIGIIFKGSKVYRIGGDEFVVILEEEEYRNRSELLNRLRLCEGKRDFRSKHPEEQISISAGMGVYEPGRDHSFMDVFRRADVRMYERKQAQKIQRK